MKNRISMRLNRATKLRHSGGLILGVAATLGFAAYVRADSNDVRYVEVQSVLGQMYDTAIAADDADTFGLSIPRGTALPRRMYAVRNLGVPMIQKLRQPQYKDVLLRHPKRNHTEYLDPNPESDQTVNPTPPVISVATGAGASDNVIILSWPVAGADWRLESAPALIDGSTVWTPISPSLCQTNGDTISFVETVQPSGTKFFRLHKP
jgi:hypothetical protein